MGNKLPVYKLVINDTEEDSGVNIVSFVDDPAIEQDFMVFSENMKYKADPKRRIVTGAAMLADTLIYRNNGGEEFNVIFEKDTIEKIVKKFFKNKNVNNVNLMHEVPTEGVYMFESFIVDSERGIQAPKGYPKVPEGSYFVSYFIENDQVWQDVLDGKFKGFSIEGFFNRVEMKSQVHKEVDNYFKDL